MGKEGEGITAMMSQSGWLPLVGADASRMASYREYVQMLADKSGQPVVLARFTQREDVEIIRPRTQPDERLPAVDIGTGRNEETGEQIAAPLVPPEGNSVEIYDPDEESPFPEEPND